MATPLGILLTKPRRKKGVQQPDEAPFPVPIETITQKPASNSRWFFYQAQMINDNVIVQNEGDVVFLHKMGFFGKGILSRSKPEHEFFASSFQGSHRKKLPPKERRFQQQRFQQVRQHKYERHLSWQKQLTLQKKRAEEEQAARVAAGSAISRDSTGSSTYKFLAPPTKRVKRATVSERNYRAGINTTDKRRDMNEQRWSLGVTESQDEVEGEGRMRTLRKEESTVEPVGTSMVAQGETRPGLGWDHGVMDTGQVSVPAGDGRADSSCLRPHPDRNTKGVSLEDTNYYGGERRDDAMNNSVFQSKSALGNEPNIDQQSSFVPDGDRGSEERLFQDGAVKSSSGGEQQKDSGSSACDQGLEGTRFQEMAWETNLEDSCDIDLSCTSDSKGEERADERAMPCSGRPEGRPLSGSTFTFESSTWNFDPSDWANEAVEGKQSQVPTATTAEVMETAVTTSSAFNTSSDTSHGKVQEQGPESVNGQMKLGSMEDVPGSEQRQLMDSPGPTDGKGEEMVEEGVPSVTSMGVDCTPGSPEEQEKGSSRGNTQHSSWSQGWTTDPKDWDMDVEKQEQPGNWEESSPKQENSVEGQTTVSEQAPTPDKNQDEAMPSGHSSCGRSDSALPDGGQDKESTSMQQGGLHGLDPPETLGLKGFTEDGKESGNGARREGVDRSLPDPQTELHSRTFFLEDTPVPSMETNDARFGRGSDSCHSTTDVLVKVPKPVEFEDATSSQTESNNILSLRGRSGHAQTKKEREHKVVRNKDPYPIFEYLQLGYEEAFFLAYGLGCLNLQDANKKPMDLTAMWRTFRRLQASFVANYIVYHFLRSKGWVLKTGLKFGADFVLYKKGPPFYHASYCVYVTMVNEEDIDQGGVHKMKWASLMGMDRVIENAAKELMFCFVIKPSSLRQRDLDSPACIPRFRVQEMLMKRWVPSRERQHQPAHQAFGDDAELS